MPDHVLAEWEKICALPGRGGDKNKLNIEFQEEALKIPGTSFDSDYFRKFRKVEDTTSSGTKWDWRSWTQVVGKFGEAVAQELVNGGGIEARKYSWINDATTSLKWPDTHEFRVEVEAGSKMRNKTEGMVEDSGKVQGDAAAFDEAFEKSSRWSSKEAPQVDRAAQRKDSEPKSDCRVESWPQSMG